VRKQTIAVVVIAAVAAGCASRPSFDDARKAAAEKRCEAAGDVAVPATASDWYGHTVDAGYSCIEPNQKPCETGCIINPTPG
jgi:hypothetical protein